MDGFWSISVCNAARYFKPNKLNAYTINNITTRHDADGASTVQFGGCDGKIPNCLRVPKDWNRMMRLGRPRQEVLNGTSMLPKAKPAA